jgi:hypothetical protein
MVAESHLLILPTYEFDSRILRKPLVEFHVGRYASMVTPEYLEFDFISQRKDLSEIRIVVKLA